MSKNKDDELIMKVLLDNNDTMTEQKYTAKQLTRSWKDIQSNSEDLGS